MTAPSYEHLAALVLAQERMIARLQAWIAERDTRIAELEQLAASAELIHAAVERRAGQAGAEVAARSSGRNLRDPSGYESHMVCPGRAAQIRREMAMHTGS